MKLQIIGLLMFLTSCSTQQNKIAETPELGKVFNDGIVFYLLKDGDSGYIPTEVHGFIAMPEDLKDTYKWGCFDVYYTDNELGGGYDNTKNIIKICGTDNMAYEADKLGWYVPNRAEIKKLYLNRSFFNNFTGMYWTSSVSSRYGFAIAYSMQTGNSPADTYYTTNKLKVRPIKKF